MREQRLKYYTNKYNYIKAFQTQVLNNHISAYASSTAFFIFLSLIPIILLICSIIPYTPITEADFMIMITKAMPTVIDPLLVGIISEMYDKSIGLISVAALITVWSAGKGVFALMRGLNVISGVNETRNYFMLRIRAACYTLIVLVVIILSLGIMVFGNFIAQILLKDIPDVKYIFKLFVHLRFFIVLLVLVFVFVMLYTWLPNKRLRMKEQLPGAIFAAVIWSLFSWAFSIYIDKFGGFSIYGSLTTIIITMMWLYICMYIIMLGAQINSYVRPVVRFVHHKREERKTESDR